MFTIVYQFIVLECVLEHCDIFSITLELTLLTYLLFWSIATGKPGKVRECDTGQGKVRETVVCLWSAAAVAIVTK